MAVTPSDGVLDELRHRYADKADLAVSAEDSTPVLTVYRVSWVEPFMSMRGGRTTRVVRWLAWAGEVSDVEYGTREEALGSVELIRVLRVPPVYRPLLPPTRALPATYSVSSFDSPVDVAASMTWREVFFTALGHARPLIEATEGYPDADTLERARRVALSTRPISEPGLQALADVVAIGGHYLYSNGFSSDRRFPDDALAARVLDDAGDRVVYRVCKTLPNYLAAGSDQKHLSDLDAQRAAENAGVDEVIEVIAGRITRRWSRMFVPDLNRRAWRPVS